MQNPQFDKPIMFNALPVIDREWNVYFVFYIKMVHYYPIQIKVVINKLGQKKSVSTTCSFQDVISLQSVTD